MGNFLNILDEMHKAADTLRCMKNELIHLQRMYLIEKCSNIMSEITHNVPHKGTYDQYKSIRDEVWKSSNGGRNIHDILSKEELKLFSTDICITSNYEKLLSDDLGLV